MTASGSVCSVLPALFDLGSSAREYAVSQSDWRTLSDGGAGVSDSYLLSVAETIGEEPDM